MKPLATMFRILFRKMGRLMDIYRKGTALMNPHRLWTAAFVLAMLMGSAVFAVEGSGGGPEVLSQGAQVHFAEGVVFNVEVSAESPVVEVKLNFRNANDGPWNYVYLDLEPSTRIEAEHLLETDGAIYIPPLASLEYYYTVRDAAGNVSESPLQSLLYTDTRFSWESVTAGPLVLLYHDLSRSRVERFAASLEEPLARVEEILGDGPEEPMVGVIYNHEREVRRAFPRLSRTIDEEQIFHGFAFSDWNLFAGIGLKESLIVHEAAHLMLDAAIQDPSPPIPAWLNEGFASYSEPGSRAPTARALEGRGGSLIPLRGMQAMTGRISDIGYFYRKSESVVTHLIEEHGAERFRELLWEFGQGLSIDDALMETYGFDQDGLEREWRQASGYVPPNEPSSSRSPGVEGKTDDVMPEESPPVESSRESGGDMLFLQIESVLLGAAVLVVAAVLGARFLYGRLSPRRPGRGDGDDGWSGGYWED